MMKSMLHLLVCSAVVQFLSVAASDGEVMVTPVITAEEKESEAARRLNQAVLFNASQNTGGCYVMTYAGEVETSSGWGIWTSDGFDHYTLEGNPVAGLAYAVSNTCTVTLMGDPGLLAILVVQAWNVGTDSTLTIGTGPALGRTDLSVGETIATPVSGGETITWSAGSAAPPTEGGPPGFKLLLQALPTTTTVTATTSTATETETETETSTTATETVTGPLCSGFMCNANSQLIAAAGSTVGNDQATCCDQLCSGYACGANTMQMLGASTTLGNDQATCCVQLCTFTKIPNTNAFLPDGPVTSFQLPNGTVIPVSGGYAKVGANYLAQQYSDFLTTLPAGTIAINVDTCCPCISGCTTDSYSIQCGVQATETSATSTSSSSTSTTGTVTSAGTGQAWSSSEMSQSSSSTLATSGARCSQNLTVVSPGNGGPVQFWVDGQLLRFSSSPGMNLAVLNAAANPPQWSLVNSTNANGSSSLAAYLSGIPSGSVVMLGAMGEAATGLSNDDKAALQRLGAQQISSLVPGAGNTYSLIAVVPSQVRGLEAEKLQGLGATASKKVAFRPVWRRLPSFAAEEKKVVAKRTDSWRSRFGQKMARQLKGEPTFLVSSGLCMVDPSGCAMSPNYPSSYDNSQSCNISYDGPPSFIQVAAFQTESCCDQLHLGNISYAGSFPEGLQGSASGPFTWTSDYSIVYSGWKLCPVLRIPNMTTTTVASGEVGPNMTTTTVASGTGLTTWEALSSSAGTSAQSSSGMSRTSALPSLGTSGFLAASVLSAVTGVLAEGFNANGPVILYAQLSTVACPSGQSLKSNANTIQSTDPAQCCAAANTVNTPAVSSPTPTGGTTSPPFVTTGSPNTGTVQSSGGGGEGCNCPVVTTGTTTTTTKPMAFALQGYFSFTVARALSDSTGLSTDYITVDVQKLTRRLSNLRQLQSTQLGASYEMAVPSELADTFSPSTLLAKLTPSAIMGSLNAQLTAAGIPAASILNFQSPTVKYFGLTTSQPGSDSNDGVPAAEPERATANIGLIAGAAGGGAVVLLIVGAFLGYKIRQRCQPTEGFVTLTMPDGSKKQVPWKAKEQPKPERRRLADRSWSKKETETVYAVELDEETLMQYGFLIEDNPSALNSKPPSTTPVGGVRKPFERVAGHGAARMEVVRMGGHITSSVPPLLDCQETNDSGAPVAPLPSSVSRMTRRSRRGKTVSHPFFEMMEWVEYYSVTNSLWTHAQLLRVDTCNDTVALYRVIVGPKRDPQRLVGIERFRKPFVEGELLSYKHTDRNGSVRWIAATCLSECPIDFRHRRNTIQIMGTKQVVPNVSGGLLRRRFLPQEGVWVYVSPLVGWKPATVLSEDESDAKPLLDLVGHTEIPPWPVVTVLLEEETEPKQVGGYLVRRKVLPGELASFVKLSSGVERRASLVSVAGDTAHVPDDIEDASSADAEAEAPPDVRVDIGDLSGEASPIASL